MAWAAPIVDDFDGALRGALVSLRELRRQDEPFWTTMALSSLGGLEMVAGRDDEAAFGHLSESRDLAERFDNAWLAAWSQTLLGTLAVRQGRLSEARALLDEALGLSMGAYSTSMVTLCLAGFARLSFVEGDAERAGLLAGAADGLRRRAGLRAWPMLREMEAELVTQIREALGADRFDQMYADGTRLKQLEAVAAVRDMRRASTQAS